MDAEKNLILSFKKSSGNMWSFSVPYPKDDIDGADVLALANYMITNKVIIFQDMTELASFEKAYVQEVTKTAVNTNL